MASFDAHHFAPTPSRTSEHAVYLSRRHQPLTLRLLVDFLAARFGGETAPWDRGLPAGGG